MFLKYRLKGDDYKLWPDEGAMVDFPSSVSRRGEFLRQQTTCVVHNRVAVIIVVDGSGDLDVQAHQKLLLHCRLLALAHLAADDDGCKPSRFTQAR